VARRALAGGVAWYLKGALASVMFSPVALIYCIIGILQLIRVDSRYPGVTRAMVSLVVYGGIAGLFVLSFLSTL
jgi:hypothetical protein